MKVLLIFAATFASAFAQDMGADPATAKFLELGANGGFFVLAMYWMRTDQKTANDRLVELCKESMSRLERAYTKTQPEVKNLG